MKMICVICGKEFESIKSTKKYCSQECINTARRLRYQNRDKSKEPIKNRAYNGPVKTCPICGKNFEPKNALASQRVCCYDCMPEGTQLTRGGFLAKLKEARGGQCVKCGYNKCIQALEFHHIDPTKKDFTISNTNFKILEAVEESKKCILLCSNCHRELHAGLWDLKELDLEERKEGIDLE